MNAQRTVRGIPPGPPARPLFGNLLELRRNPLDFLTACAREYGDVVRYRVMNVNVYLLNHPQHIEYVLATHSRNFVKGRALRASRTLLGNGLLLSEGDTWQRQRRLAQPAFHHDRIATYAQVVVEYAQRMLATWQDGETRDLYHEMMRLTLRIVTQSLFSFSLAKEEGKVGTALEMFMEQFRNRVNSGLLIPESIPTPSNLRMMRAIRQIEETVYGIIAARRASAQTTGDLVSVLLNARNEDGSRMSDQQLRDEVMTLLLAGHETTALTLTWAFYLLSQRPDVEAKLGAEQEAVLEGRAPTVSDLPRLRYTEMVVKESMRLYPAAWVISRVALQDCQIGGYFVPAGTSVAFSQWVMHRDPRYFDHPDLFDPDRWSDDFAKRLPKFAYFPFGGGPRICIGSSFAMMESVLLLSMIAQRYRLRRAPGQPVKLLPTLTLHPADGMKMVLEER